MTQHFEVGFLALALTLLWTPSRPAESNDFESLEAEIEFLKNYNPNNEFPGSGALIRRGDDGYALHCSGALVGPRAFLTAAHCFRNVDLTANLPGFFVFLHVEGIVGVSGVKRYCQDACGGKGGHCDADEHDIGIVELGRSAEVWPAIELAMFDPGQAPGSAHKGKRAGFGAEQLAGIKVISGVSAGQCDPSELDTMICQSDPPLSNPGDSGGPLYHESVAAGWLQTAITKGRGVGNWTRYVKAWHSDHQDWIACALQELADQIHEPQESLEIKWWGRLEHGYVPHPGGTDRQPVRIRVSSPTHIPWDEPAVPSPQVEGSDNLIDIPDGQGITRLRVTMNHWAKRAGGSTNGLALRLYPPGDHDNPPDPCPGRVFIQCEDIFDPSPGYWKIEVTGQSEDDYGAYQLVALPLGPRQSNAPEMDAAPGAPMLLPSHLGRQSLDLGATWDTGPLMRINTEPDGSPSKAIMGLIEDDLKVRIGRLQRQLDWASSGDPK